MHGDMATIALHTPIRIIGKKEIFFRQREENLLSLFFCGIEEYWIKEER
jgi:hypothetical protein